MSSTSTRKAFIIYFTVSRMSCTVREGAMAYLFKTWKDGEEKGRLSSAEIVCWRMRFTSAAFAFASLSLSYY